MCASVSCSHALPSDGWTMFEIPSPSPHRDCAAISFELHARKRRIRKAADSEAAARSPGWAGAVENGPPDVAEQGLGIKRRKEWEPKKIDSTAVRPSHSRRCTYTVRRSPGSHLDINVETLDIHLEDLADLRSNK